MSRVGGPQVSPTVKKRTLYLCRLGGFYLTSEKHVDNHAKYFREGSKRLYMTMPTWFRSELEARSAAKAQGFRVVRRKRA